MQTSTGRSKSMERKWILITVGWRSVFLRRFIGCPAINVPVGFNQDGLPMGMQIIGRNFADLAVLQLAFSYEQATQWVDKHPPPLLTQA